jgi:hypothetical protein
MYFSRILNSIIFITFFYTFFRNNGKEVLAESNPSWVSSNNKLIVLANAMSISEIQQAIKILTKVKDGMYILISLLTQLNFYCTVEHVA